MPENLITLQEAADILGLSREEVMNLAHEGTIPYYRIGGEHLRFKKHEVDEFYLKMKKEAQSRADQEASREPAETAYTRGDRLRDFWHSNDVYIIAALIIAVALYLIFK